MINKHFLFILITLLSSVTVKAQNRVNDSNTFTANGTEGTSNKPATKDVQELTAVIDEQDKIITGKDNGSHARIIQLEKQVATLETKLNNMIETRSFIAQAPKNTSLEQNKPNPAGDYTTIRYNLPPATNGEIIIYNQQGAVVKTIFANESCQSLLNVKDMVPGIYTYSLMVNGKATMEKQMLVGR